MERQCARRWQYRPSVAYVSEVTQKLPESGTGRVEINESPRWIERGAKKRDTTAYLVQIVDTPHQIIALNGWHPLLAFLPVKYAADSIVKFVARGIKKLIEVLE